MILPNNYHEIEAVDEMSQRIIAGGYVAIIKGVEDVQDKQYLKVYIDIAKGDYTNHFVNAYTKARSYDANARWSNAGVIYRSYRGNALAYFKGFIKAVEESNSNFTFNPSNEDELKGKLIGVIYGGEEYQDTQGNIKTTCKPMFTCSVSRIEDGNFKVPNIKKIARKEDSNEEYTEYNAELPF